MHLLLRAWFAYSLKCCPDLTQSSTHKTFQPLTPTQLQPNRRACHHRRQILCSLSLLPHHRWKLCCLPGGHRDGEVQE